jgi:hypothetical protein
MNYFIYLRGNPGVGKITVARILESKLGWRVFWFHDLKNAVFNIVQEHRIPRLMDSITAPVIRHLLDGKHNVIYVRPSPDAPTVAGVLEILDQYPDYQALPVRLVASYDTLLQRATGRDDPYRITNKNALDAYLRERDVAPIDGELIIETDGLTPEEVADQILTRLPK